MNPSHLLLFPRMTSFAVVWLLFMALGRSPTSSIRGSLKASPKYPGKLRRVWLYSETSLHRNSLHNLISSQIALHSESDYASIRLPTTFPL